MLYEVITRGRRWPEASAGAHGGGDGAGRRPAVRGGTDAPDVRAAVCRGSGVRDRPDHFAACHFSDRLPEFQIYPADQEKPSPKTPETASPAICLEVRDMKMHFPVRSGIVITSYSIHYTKLYEASRCARTIPIWNI